MTTTYKFRWKGNWDEVQADDRSRAVQKVIKKIGLPLRQGLRAMADNQLLVVRADLMGGLTESINEKSVSQNQQKLMGMAYALKKGEMASSEASQEVKDLAKSMTLQQLKDFAGTKHKGLPQKKGQMEMKLTETKLRQIIRSVIREESVNELGGMFGGPFGGASDTDDFSKHIGKSKNTPWKLQLDLGKVNPHEFEKWANKSWQKTHKIKVSGSGKKWVITGKGNDDRMGSSADWISQLLGKAWKLNKIKVTQKESVKEANIGDKMKHKHIDGVSIELLDTTNKGWKVKQTGDGTSKGKNKTKIAYYNSIDITGGDKALFVKESVVNESDAFILNVLSGNQVGTGRASEFLSKHKVDLGKLKKAKMQGVINSYDIRDIVTGKAHSLITKNFFKNYVKESVNEDTKKRFEVDFYKGNGDRQTSHEEIIRGDKFSDVISQATKVAKSKGMNYVEFYYKDAFIGSIDRRNGYEFKKGRNSEKSPLSVNEDLQSNDVNESLGYGMSNRKSFGYAMSNSKGFGLHAWELGNASDAVILNALSGNQVGTGRASKFLSKHKVDLRKLKKARMEGVINSYDIRDIVNGKADSFITKNFFKNYVKESVNENFIPGVGSIDDFMLKDMLMKNSKVNAMLDAKSKAFIKKPEVVVIMHQSKRFNNIFTDGKMELEIDTKSNKVVKPLGKARKAIADYFKNN